MRIQGMVVKKVQEWDNLTRRETPCGSRMFSGGMQYGRRLEEFVVEIAAGDYRLAQGRLAYLLFRSPRHRLVVLSVAAGAKYHAHPAARRT
jgi:hypothetical protein